ncbi:MAG: tryptophan--tRNA ligase [Clostridia bacterium]|nr:tryptophan--tRNA ligase [Clostridia bacterium]
MKGRILSGMRPTGRLHIGHLSVLENWVKLQEEYETYFMVADWHALTTAFDETEEIKGKIWDMLLDWLSVGIDPEKSVIFVQSHVKEHAELHLLFSMITPLSWLERCPTYKDQVQQFGEKGKDISTYGFLGYPLLQAADILIYRADTVPVGEDQLPHLELSREVARRFNHLYNARVFPEPKAKLSKLALLPGTDGRKMSKSYNNYISITADFEVISDKVRQMVTDPQRIRKTDPGNPEVCTVYLYHKIYNPVELEQYEADCRGGKIGCVACKKKLAAKMDEALKPIREKRNELEKNPDLIQDIITAGAEKARKEASITMEKVREVMKI